MADGVAEVVAVSEADLHQALALTADLAMRRNVPVDVPIEEGETRLKNPTGVQMSGYQAALATNPDLKFGQYVAATRLAQNLGSRFPNITRNAILAGLASGRSIGQTLHDLGLSDHEASDAKKHADSEIKQARKQ